MINHLLNIELVPLLTFLTTEHLLCIFTYLFIVLLTLIRVEKSPKQYQNNYNLNLQKLPYQLKQPVFNQVLALIKHNYT